MRFSEVFGDRRAFLPVIHVTGEVQALRNARCARLHGANGVFLINHRMPSADLIRIYIQVRDAHPDWWIGMNMLDRGAELALRTVPADASGLWVDYAGVSCAQACARTAAALEDRRKLRKDWQGLFFGGVAFKYQKPSASPAADAAKAVPLMDVITTSGPETGQPPTVEKIKSMREAVGKHPIAIASGMTPNNVRQFLPYADCFLVATGISSSEDELDGTAVRHMANIIHDYD